MIERRWDERCSEIVRRMAGHYHDDEIAAAIEAEPQALQAAHGGGVSAEGGFGAVSTERLDAPPKGPARVRDAGIQPNLAPLTHVLYVGRGNGGRLGWTPPVTAPSLPDSTS